jgi:hypothetical protein
MKWAILSALHTDLLYPPRDTLTLIYVRDQVVPWATVRPEGLCQWKISVLVPSIFTIIASNIWQLKQVRFWTEFAPCISEQNDCYRHYVHCYVKEPLRHHKQCCWAHQNVICASWYYRMISHGQRWQGSSRFPTICLLTYSLTGLCSLYQPSENARNTEE